MADGYVVLNEVTGEFAADKSGTWVRCKSAAYVFKKEKNADVVSGILSLFLHQDCKAVRA